MTRKKSKVKALALAVTCAILAGGYSGVNPVYAADQNVDGNITASGNITAAGGKIKAGIDDGVNKIRLVDATTDSKYIIDIIAGDFGGIEVSGKNSTGNWLRTKLGADGIISSDKGIKVGVNGKAFVVDVDGNEGNVSATGSLSVAGGKFLVKTDGTLQVENELTISHAGSNTEADPGRAATLNIDRLSKLNQLVEYSTGTQTVITAGNGSTIGGVGFTAGALTGVTSINADDARAKFIVAPNGIDGDNRYIFQAGNLEIATDKNAEGSLYKNITFTDTNSRSNTVTLVEMMDASKATKGIRRYTENDRFGTPRYVTAIESQVKIRDDGRIEINTTGSNSEQSVVIDSGAGILVGHQDQVQKLLEHDSSVTPELEKAYLNKIAGMSNEGVFAGGIKFDEAKAGMSNVDGSLKAASGKFKVNAGGAISAANNKFEVTENGELKLEDKLTIQHKGFGTDAQKSATLTIDSLDKLVKLVDPNSSDTIKLGKIEAANESKIGGVTISGGRLSVPMGTDTVGVNVSDLAADHDIITNDGQYTYSSTTVKSKIDSLEQSSEGLGAKTIQITRILNESDVEVGTSIAHNLDVYDDGTVIINDGKDAKVTIDSDRISIGNVSLIENDYVEKNGTIHYNQTINDYAKLDVKKGKIAYKVGNYSVTTSSATATGNYDVDQANKGTVFSNDTNYTRIDGAQVNSVNGGNTGILDGASLELKSGFGNIKLINDQGTFTDANGNSTEIRGAQITTSEINAKDGVNAKTISIGAHAGDTLQQEFLVAEDGNVYTKGMLSVAGGKFDVDKEGALKAANGAFSVDKDGKLISASGSKIGDVTINDESLSYGSKSITVSELASDHALVNDATKGNEKLYTELVDVQSKAQGLEAKTAGIVRDTAGTTIENTLKVGSDGTVSTVNGKFSVGADGNIVSKGTLSVADGKFVVDANGLITAGSMKMDNIEAADTNKGVNVGGVVLKNKTISAADDKFTVDENGKLISASGSKIGGVTIDGESLSNGTKSINVSNLASDHDLVNDSKKGNESLYTGLGSVQTLAQGLNTKTAGIERDTTGSATTTIEGKLKVSSDGTVKINEGADQQVIIDSNGIKVGKNSSRMNDSYGFATTRDLYVGADSADAPTAAGSKFYVKGSDGSIKAANGKFTVGADGDITASGVTAKTITAGKSSATDPEFMVDEDGNLTSRGKLSAAGGKFSVDADGALSAANGAFTVDHIGNVVTNGTVRLNSGANSTQLTAGGVTFIKDGKTTTIAGDTVTVSGSGVNKSFNLSDIADVGQNMTNLGNRINAEETKRAQEVSRLDTAINDEKTKREQDVSRLDTAINDEKTKREQEVSRLNTAINDEKTKREQEVSRLDTAINDEKTKREQEVSRLDTAINDEKTKREQEVSRLDTAINDEKTKREQEVSRLDTAINDEKTKREQDVTDLNGRVDAVNSRVDNINTDFTSRIDTVQSNVDAEKTKREQEVTRLDGRIDDVNTNLGNRIDTVSNNLGDLDKLDSDLKARDEYTNNSSVVGGINAEAAVRKEEVTRLDTAIADEAAARQADVARLDGRISDISSRINKVGAMAAAISSLKTMGYDPESPTEFSVGLGQYKGETGVALGFFHYPNKNFMINVSLSTSSGEIMGGIGATWRFGHKSPQKLLEEQRAAQAEKEIAAAEAYKAARAAKKAQDAK